MKRYLSMLVALTATLGMIGLSPASATHDDPTGHPDPPTAKKNDGPHENQPRPPKPGNVSGDCTVQGFVTVDNYANTGGVGPQGNPLNVGKDHNHFRFEDTVIVCTANEAKDPTGNDGGTFKVLAAGGTDGPGECSDPGLPPKDPKCATNHGESLEAGWSHGDCYAVDCPAITMKPTNKTFVDDLYTSANTNPVTGTTQNMNEIAVHKIVGDPPVGTTKKSCSTGFDPATDTFTPTATCDNWLKFCRGTHDDFVGTENPMALRDGCDNLDKGGTDASLDGGNVLAWGALVWDAGGPADKTWAVTCFLANLTLVPNDEQPHLVSNGKLTDFELVGTAVLWQETDKDNCHGKKNPTPPSGLKNTTTTLPI